MKKRKEVTFDWKFQRMNPDDEKQLQIVIDSVITEIVFKYLRERDKADEPRYQHAGIIRESPL
jgi:hypothetical protein